MVIRLAPGESVDTERELAGGGLHLMEVLEGAEEFLDALVSRLNEIVKKPSGRFVISFVNGTPGSKPPPTVH